MIMPTALAIFSKAKAGDPKNITYYVSLARTHSLIAYQSTAAADKEAHLKEAMAVLNQARAISQYDSQVLNDYGKCCFELAQLYQYSGSPSSTAMYREALAHSPTSRIMA
jgi:tetratricopeptide (TPR) repeat protein